MSRGFESRLQTDTIPVDDLVDMVRVGKIRIPSFQRGLRWNRSDVIKLFDSIVLGYPIGNLLLWSRSAAEVKGLQIGSLSIDAPQTDQALFVVDGQQRLTSLSNALLEQGHNDPRFALAYDVFKEQFVPATGKSVGEIPLPVVFDLSRLLQWYASHPELTDDPALVSRANDVAKAIRGFRVPVYIVENSDADVLRDIFDRMNNYGKQLSRAEIFSALHESGSGERTGAAGPTDLGEISFDVHAATGFGVVDQDTILLAMLARRGPDISRDIRREFRSAETLSPSTAELEFPGETPDEARRRVTESLVAAIRFLQLEAHAPHFAFLPYRYLLVVLTRFFAHFPEPKRASLRNLRRWFWRAASLGPELTKGNITFATRTLCSRIVPGNEEASIKGLLSLVGDTPNSRPEIAQFRTNYAATRLLLAAMWSLRPRRLQLTGHNDAYSFEDLLSALGEGSTAVDQALPIFSSHAASAEERSLPGNRIFLAEPNGSVPDSVLDNLRALSARSLEGDKEAKAVLASHAITSETAAMLLAPKYPRVFLNARQKDLSQILTNFLMVNAEWQYEDTPSLDSLDLDQLGERDDELDIDEHDS